MILVLLNIQIHIGVIPTLASIINVYCDAKIKNLVDNSEYSQIYKNLFWQLRKLINFPYKRKKQTSNQLIGDSTGKRS